MSVVFWVSVLVLVYWGGKALWETVSAANERVNADIAFLRAIPADMEGAL
jgi:hypothetical protein